MIGRTQEMSEGLRIEEITESKTAVSKLPNSCCCCDFKTRDLVFLIYRTEEMIYFRDFIWKYDRFKFLSIM